MTVDDFDRGALIFGRVLSSFLFGIGATDPLTYAVVSIVLLSLAYGMYVIDKEIHLHRLSKLLMEERILSATLTDRLREVTHEPDEGLVFEVAFEGLQRSTRHKSGLAMRFPRISRIRWDKPAHEADTIATLKRMVT